MENDEQRMENETALHLLERRLNHFVLTKSTQERFNDNKYFDNEIKHKNEKIEEFEQAIKSINVFDKLEARIKELENFYEETKKYFNEHDQFYVWEDIPDEILKKYNVSSEINYEHFYHGEIIKIILNELYNLRDENV